MNNDRRNLALSLLVATAAAGTAQAQIRSPFKGKPPEKDKTDKPAIAPVADVTLSPSESLVASSLALCSATATQCLSFCIESLAAGDTSMAECARSVRDVMVLCEASKELIYARSPNTRALLTLCRQVCANCQKTCEVHAMHHSICRACAQACETAVNAMNVVLG